MRRYYIAMGKTPETMGAVASFGYRWVLLGGVWLIYFCFGLMITSLAPLITPITTELGIGHAKMGAILGAWPLTASSSQFPLTVPSPQISRIAMQDAKQNLNDIRQPNVLLFSAS